MRDNYEEFLKTIENNGTKKVVRSFKDILNHDYENITPIELDQIILDAKPKSIKEITTIAYIIGLYAKYLSNDDLYYMASDIDRNAIWLRAKKSADKKFISNKDFLNVYKQIDMYEDFNQLYIQTLFRSLYEGIYNDDLSVVKNLRGSDINENIVTLKDDNENAYSLMVSDRLADDLVKLGKLDTWERKNRYGSYNIKTSGLYKDTCFKVENRKGTAEYSYRYSYYRILRKVSKDYLGYNLLPLQLYVSGMMHRICVELDDRGIKIDEAFSNNNKNRTVGNIISSELSRCNCDMPVRNFREMVKGHLEIFEINRG